MTQLTIFAALTFQIIDNWVETNFDRCFQLMECDHAELFQEWITHWKDLVDFEVVQVITSQQAGALTGPEK
jgi:hypothetical protein